jgi:hypothetical protein
MNIDPSGFIELLITSNSMISLFWNNLYTIMFSDYVAIHPFIADILQLLFPSQ